MKKDLSTTIGLFSVLMVASASAIGAVSFSALGNISSAPALSDEQLGEIEGGELLPSPINIQVNPSLQVSMPTQVGINLGQNISILSSNINQSVQQGVFQFGNIPQR